MDSYRSGEPVMEHDLVHCTRWPQFVPAGWAQYQARGEYPPASSGARRGLSADDGRSDVREGLFEADAEGAGVTLREHGPFEEGR